MNLLSGGQYDRTCRVNICILIGRVHLPLHLPHSGDEFWKEPPVPLRHASALLINELLRMPELSSSSCLLLSLSTVPLQLHHAFSVPTTTWQRIFTRHRHTMAKLMITNLSSRSKRKRLPLAMHNVFLCLRTPVCIPAFHQHAIHKHLSILPWPLNRMVSLSSTISCLPPSLPI